MKTVRYIFFLGWSIVGLALPAQAIADGCFDPGLNDTFVSPYGGADLTCPQSIPPERECVISFKNGAVDDESDGCSSTNLSITVTIDQDSGALDWTSSAAPSLRVDASLTDSAQGGKGCLYSYGTDKEFGRVGYQRSSGEFFPASKAVFCSDGVEEVTAEIPPPAVVNECILESGTSQEIYGVTFSCPEVPAGETRSIIVIQDTVTVDIGGVPTLVEPPGFGFLGTGGNIDFNNVCQCVGPSQPGVPPPAPVQKVECDPDPANQDAGCEIGPDAENPVVITVQNPKCFWIGGFARCF